MTIGHSDCHLTGIKLPDASHKLPPMDQAALNKLLADIGYTLPDFCRAVQVATGNTLHPNQIRGAFCKSGRLSQPMQAAIRLGVLYLGQLQDGRKA